MGKVKKKSKSKALTGWVKLVGEDQIRQLREACISENGKVLWIHKYLDDEQIAELYFRLLERNEDQKKLSKVVRDDWGILPHWPLQNFYKGMKKWVKRLETDYHNLSRSSTTTPKLKYQANKKRKEAHKLFKRLDILGRLGYAIELQTDRLNMIHQMEKDRGLPSKHTDVIQSTLSKMGARYIDAAIKTGVLAGVPHEVNVNLQAKSELVHAELIAGDGQKWGRAAQDFLDKMEQHVIEMGKNTGAKEYKMITDESSTEE